jgi:hypothetical protein
MNTKPTGQDNVSGRDGGLWVEPVGDTIVARVRGTATAELLRECQKRVIALQRDTGCDRILYDALEMNRPAINIVLTQQTLTDEFKGGPAKIAIVVPNTGIAYLSRIAFGDVNHRVFYNDITAAVLWLNEGVSGSKRANKEE